MGTATKKRTGIELAASDLKAALAAVSPAVPTRSPKLIYQAVRLGDGLLTGSDGEVRIDVAIDYHGDAILLPHGRLSQILGAATGETVTLEPGETSCVVKAGSSTWTLPTENASEYPMWEPNGLKAICRLPADQFGRAARATFYACDEKSSRYALGGVLIEVRDGNPTWVATDGRRLSVVETETDQAVDDSETLIPARTIKILCNLLKRKKKKVQIEDSQDEHEDRYEVDPSFGSVQIEANATEAVFSIDGVTITSRLLEGRFPKWRDLLKDVDSEPSTVLVKSLAGAVKAAAIVTTEASRGIDFAFSETGLWLHGQSSEAGESSVTCDLVEAGTACTVKLDPRHVRQWLEGLPADGEPTVSVQAKDGQSAVILRTDCHTGVVMPM
jgi:DNA polymerase-3 subunit beta